MLGFKRPKPEPVIDRQTAFKKLAESDKQADSSIPAMQNLIDTKQKKVDHAKEVLHNAEVELQRVKSDLSRFTLADETRRIPLLNIIEQTADPAIDAAIESLEQEHSLLHGQEDWREPIVTDSWGTKFAGSTQICVNGKELEAKSRKLHHAMAQLRALKMKDVADVQKEIERIVSAI